MRQNSSLLWLGAIAAVITYLSNSIPLTEWSYNDWLKAASFVVAWLMGKLDTPPKKKPAAAYVTPRHDHK